MCSVSDGLRRIGEPGSPLLSSAAEGNREALSSLLESARPVVHRWAILKTDDPDDAEDITQMVLLKLFSKLSTFRGESNISSWLYRVTANEALRVFRKKAKDKAKTRRWLDGGQPPSVVDPDDERIDRESAVGAIRSVAHSLPSLQFAAFRLVDLEGLRPSEAARELGRTQTTTRSSLCRARKKIRELVLQAQRDLATEMGYLGEKGLR